MGKFHGESVEKRQGFSGPMGFITSIIDQMNLQEQDVTKQKLSQVMGQFEDVVPAQTAQEVDYLMNRDIPLLHFLSVYLEIDMWKHQNTTQREVMGAGVYATDNSDWWIFLPSSL